MCQGVGTRNVVPIVHRHGTAHTNPTATVHLVLSTSSVAARRSNPAKYVYYYKILDLEKDRIMVRKRLDAASVLTVPVLLNESQKSSSSGQLRYARMLWSLVEDDAETTVLQLVRGLKIFVTVAEVRWRACHWRFLLAEQNEFQILLFDI